MARWRVLPGRIEPPEWYRNFHREAWETPDEHEQRMIDGWRGHLGQWPAHLHYWHAERRWHEAKYAYRREHPDLAEQEFDDIVTRHRERRRGLGWDVR